MISTESDFVEALGLIFKTSNSLYRRESNSQSNLDFGVAQVSVFPFSRSTKLEN